VNGCLAAFALATALGFWWAGGAFAQGQVAVPEDDRLPVPEERATTALDKSRRRAEWTDISVPGTATSVRAWVVHPDRKDSAPVVVVLHEASGLTDWIRAVADQLAHDGFIAVAPDLVSDGALDAAIARLEAVRAFALKVPAGTGKVAAVGFSWGGTAAFAFAASQPALDAAVVYYGSAPVAATLGSIRAPVLGLYAGADPAVNVTIAPAQEAIRGLGRTFDPHVFEGAGHGFLRAQGERDGANLKATRQAWPATLAFLREHLK
jgi:carboxymethylenebutenolidase